MAQIDALFSLQSGKVGEAYVYTGGPTVAAVMMKRATGKTYESLMAQYVFRPFGMTTAGFALSRAKESATAYYLEGGRAILGQLRLDEDWRVDPSGSVRCTISDLARFGAMYADGASQGNGHLKESTFRELLQVPKTPGTTIGSLWWEGSWPGWYMHNGSTGRGEYAWMAFNPTLRLSVAVYYNENRRDGSLRFDDLEIDLAKKIVSGELTLGN